MCGGTRRYISRLTGAWVGAALVAALGCGGAQSEPEQAEAQERPLPSLAETYGSAEESTAGGNDALDVGSWPESSRSPQPMSAIAAPDVALYQRCGDPDRALALVASRVIERRMDGSAPFSPREMELLLRAHGLPQVWPRAITIAGLEEGESLHARLERWANAEPHRGLLRCGLARGADDQGKPLLSVVTVDALADLSPVPTRVRLSSWIELDGVLHVPAEAVHVLLLGPQGRPRKVPASISGGRFQSRFSLDQPGPWLIQVLADLAGGPMPVLAVRVFAGVEPTTSLAEPRAPGKPTELIPSAPAAEQATALARLVNSARRAEGLPALRRDAELDRLAANHARRMAARGRLAHDLGEGTVERRLASAGWKAVHVGENVAAARSIDAAYRALWASPSHRNNLLAGGFRRVGVGVASGADGTLWVAQIFSE